MVKTYNANGNDEIRISFELSNNLGFIPLYTRVFLDLQNGMNSHEPMFVTPMHLTDASIPSTPLFKHNKGLLFFETYISYKSLNNQSNDVIMEKAKKLVFKYSINSSSGASQDFSTYDLGPTIIKNKELIYFVALIDLV
jgi:hypothetical protein